MDMLVARLEEACRTGDVNLLKELLNQDNQLLERLLVRTSVREKPLHIAAMLGHADFVREVIYHKPELAKELNDQNLSPLHLAAAHGHVNVVKELLMAGSDLCLISETQRGLLPLHIAVMNRRTVIVKELVEACEEAVHRLTTGGETIVMLAIKYNSFDTVEFLIDRVQDLNAKDDIGNTILHHAVKSRQLSVIKILLSKADIDVNTMNSVSLTPLDVLLKSVPKKGDLIIGETIAAAGGKSADVVMSKGKSVIRDSVSCESSKTSNPIPNPVRSSEIVAQHLSESEPANSIRHSVPGESSNSTPNPGMSPETEAQLVAESEPVNSIRDSVPRECSIPVPNPGTSPGTEAQVMAQSEPANSIRDSVPRESSIPIPNPGKSPGTEAQVTAESEPANSIGDSVPSNSSNPTPNPATSAENPTSNEKRHDATVLLLVSTLVAVSPSMQD